LIASHDLGLIARMPHRLLTLRDGSLMRGVERADDAGEPQHG
jgi:ABC-type ATPase involved in cell division